MKIFPFLSLTIIFTFNVNGIQSENDMTTIGIQLNNENTTNVSSEIVSIILLNATATTTTENDTIQDINNKLLSISTQDFSENIIKLTKPEVDNIISEYDITNDNNVTNSDKQVLWVSKDVNKTTAIFNSNELPSPSYEVNVSDSQLLAHEDLKEFLDENPDAVVIASENYPNPYPDDYNQTWSLSVSKGTGIDVIVHDLDINPLTDFLYFRGGIENSTREKGPTITGHRTTQLRFKILHTTNLFIWCHASQQNEDRNYTGFRLTYAPFGEIRSTTTEPDQTITVPANQIETIDILLVVPKSMQKDETWQSFKNILSKSANKYIQEYHLPVELARQENVSISFINNCPDHWPNSDSCIKFRFGIPLWPIEHYVGDSDEIETETAYYLRKDSLTQMWAEYGIADFERAGTPMYELPDGGYMIVLWSGISLGIIATFLLVLFMIWKMDLFQEYKRMTNGIDDRQNILKNQSEIDISMFPSPHQIVPTLFPTNDTYIAGSTTINQSFNDSDSRSNSRKTSFSAHKLVDFPVKHSIMDTEEEIIAFSKTNSNPSTPRSRAKVFIRGSSKNSSQT